MKIRAQVREKNSRVVVFEGKVVCEGAVLPFVPVSNHADRDE